MPFALGLEIFKRAGSSDKQMVDQANVGHSGLWNADGVDGIFGFVDRIGQLP